MLLVSMYHRIGKGKLTNDYHIFRQHLELLARNYSIVIPGCTLPPRQLSVCLSFDDASFDFYFYVFPILKKLQIKALLAVPVKYICEDTTCRSDVRLGVSYREAMMGDVFHQKTPFCTWKELKEMSDSGYVKIASHSYNHKDLTEENVDLQEEVILSKEILERKLGSEISTFVYPFGKTNKNIHKYVALHYENAMRIGNAVNKGWHDNNRLLCRVDGDCLEYPQQLLSWRRCCRYFLKYYINCFRFYQA